MHSTSTGQLLFPNMSGLPPDTHLNPQQSLRELRSPNHSSGLPPDTHLNPQQSLRELRTVARVFDPQAPVDSVDNTFLGFRTEFVASY